MQNKKIHLKNLVGKFPCDVNEANLNVLRKYKKLKIDIQTIKAGRKLKATWYCD